jgi:hypothetical protein
LQPSLKHRYLSSLNWSHQPALKSMFGICLLQPSFVDLVSRSTGSYSDLFHFGHTEVTCQGGSCTVDGPDERNCYVQVEVGDGIPNDLVSKLAIKLSKYEDGRSLHDVISQPSELLCFTIEQAQKLPDYTPTTTKSTPDPFTYPRMFFLDRFMNDNIQLVNAKRGIEHKMVEEIAALEKEKDFLTKDNVRIVSLMRSQPLNHTYFREEIQSRI